ncbi:MAG TPA: endonuclease MutS2 [Trueperaceae bacterium]
MIVAPTTLEKLAFPRVRRALADRTMTRFGARLAQGLSPSGDPEEVASSLERTEEVLEGGDLSLGGIEDIEPLLERLREGGMAEGSELLQIAYTLDSAATAKRAILASNRPRLSELAARMGSFDGVLRLVREQLDPDGNVRDDATPKLREIRRRLNPLRNRIREKLQQLINHYSEYIQDPIVTLRRDRYVIPVRSSSQSRVPGIALDTSDSGATVFLEPQSVVPLNNELALLEFEERDEVRRILIELGRRLANAPGVDETLDLVARLDLVQASAALARDWRLARPELHEGGRVRLQAARHPLIEDCVPNDIELTDERRLLVVTGPNAGGKTVLIKTLGLAALMSHSGLFVAASGENPPLLPRLEKLLVDIGDEQSIEASLSTYAGHLTNLRRIVDEAHERVLVLIDELGSGTDPDEGAALSQAILERVLASGARGLITTHLAPLKVFASRTEGILNAAMRFDVDRLQPSYRLTVGQPGRSYALAIARRLGLGEELLDRASRLLGPEGERLEALLEELEEQREALRRELDEARTARDTAVGEAEVLRAQIDRLRAREDEVMAAAAERAEEMLQDTLQRAKELKRTATSDPGQRPRALEEIRELRRGARERLRKSEQEASGPRWVPGTLVRVESYEAEGPIVEVRGDDVVVQLGLLKVEVPRREVRLLEAPRPKPVAVPTQQPGSSIERELNIRGARVEEGIEQVRELILEAHAMKVDKVRILHGKGTGALRDAVRNYLRDEKRVERFEDAVPYEGGHGVTVAYLRV